MFPLGQLKIFIQWQRDLAASPGNYSIAEEMLEAESFALYSAYIIPFKISLLKCKLNSSLLWQIFSHFPHAYIFHKYVDCYKLISTLLFIKSKHFIHIWMFFHTLIVQILWSFPLTVCNPMKEHWRRQIHSRKQNKQGQIRFLDLKKETPK